MNEKIECKKVESFLLLGVTKIIAFTSFRISNDKTFKFFSQAETAKYTPICSLTVKQTKPNNRRTVDCQPTIGFGFIAQAMVLGVNRALQEVLFSTRNVMCAK